MFNEKPTSYEVGFFKITSFKINFDKLNNFLVKEVFHWYRSMENHALLTADIGKE